MPPDRVMVYIDGSNLFHSLRSIANRSDLDYAAFASKLAGDRHLVRTYFYSASFDQIKEPDNFRSQQRFFQALSRVDYLEVRLGRLVYGNWPQVAAYQKGVDVRLATDMLVHSCNDRYDVAVLVSGDTDFVHAVQAVKDAGLHVEVALFDRGGSQQLREVADRVIEVAPGYLSDCWLK